MRWIPRCPCGRSGKDVRGTTGPSGAGGHVSTVAGRPALDEWSHYMVMPTRVPITDDRTGPGLIMLTAQVSTWGDEGDESYRDNCYGKVDLDDEWTPYDIYLGANSGGGYVEADRIVEWMTANLNGLALTITDR